MYSNGATKVPVSKEKLSKGMSLALAIAEVETVDAFYQKSEMEMENALHVAESMMSNGRSEVTAKQTSEKRGFVYIITNPAYPGYVKIGKALDVLSRLNSYHTYSPKRDYKPQAEESASE